MKRIKNQRYEPTHIQRTTQKIRKCLGIKPDGSYCTAEIDSVDAAERLCVRCRQLNIPRSKQKTVQRIDHSSSKGDVYVA